ncbi:MAG: hypothetical protein ACRDTA_26290 [Pseudonocardiaceae bacterium]
MQIVELIPTVVAPLALVTAILGYIGWVRTRAFYNYFGLSSSLVSLSPQDYVLRSAEPIFGAVYGLTLWSIGLLVADRILMWLLGRLDRWEKWVRWALVGLGAALIVVSLNSAGDEASVGVIPPITPALLVGLGAVVLLRYGMGSAGRDSLLPPAAVGVSMVAIALAGFWATTFYAQTLGKGAAEAIDQNPRDLPVVTVYSREPLDLPGTNVAARRILDQDQQWNYQYTGARLLTYSNNRWFLIPEPQSPCYRSPVTVLPDTDTIRVETAVPREWPEEAPVVTSSDRPLPTTCKGYTASGDEGI